MDPKKGIFSRRPQIPENPKVVAAKKLQRKAIEGQRTTGRATDRSGPLLIPGEVVNHETAHEGHGNAVGVSEFGSSSTLSAVNIRVDVAEIPKKEIFTKRSSTSLSLKTPVNVTPQSTVAKNVPGETLNSIRSASNLIKLKPDLRRLPKKGSKIVPPSKKKEIIPVQVEEKHISRTEVETVNSPKENEEICGDTGDDLLYPGKDLSSIEESLSLKSSPNKVHLKLRTHNLENLTPRSLKLKKSPRKNEKTKTKTFLPTPVETDLESKPDYSESDKQSSNIKNQQSEFGEAKSGKTSSKFYFNDYNSPESGDANFESLKKIEEKIDNDTRNSNNSTGGEGQGPLIDYVNMLDTLEREKLDLESCIDTLNVKLMEAEKKINKLEPSKNDNIKEYKKKLIDNQNSLKEKEKEIHRIININQSLEEHKKGVDMKNEILLRELSQCEIRIDKFRNENNLLKKSIFQLQNKTNLEAEDEFRILYENERGQCEKLRNMVTENLKQMDSLTFELKSLKESSSKMDVATSNELENLKLKYEKIQLEKEVLEVEKQKLEASKPPDPDEKLRRDLRMYKIELEELKQNNEILSDMLEKLENGGNINNNGTGISVDEFNEVTINFKHEIEALQTTIFNLKHENDHLNTEVFRQKVEAKQMQETNFMNQRLLRIRGELIKYFHENKEKCSINDIYPGLNRPGGLIEEDIYLKNSQIPIRINELQKLSSSLDTRDTDLTKKNQVIKLLEENDDRNKKLLTKLEDQNTRLELEVSELRRLLRMNANYQ